MTSRLSSESHQPRFGRSIRARSVEAIRGIDREVYTEIFEDFLGVAGDTLPTPWTATGTGTDEAVDYVAASSGTFQLAHGGTSEAQTMRLDFGDALLIPANNRPWFTCRWKLNLVGAALSADQRLVVGLASAYNATLDSVAANAWFRVEGASLNLLAETDDGTTDDDDNDTTHDIADDTYLTTEIDMSDLSAVKFWVNGETLTTLSMADLGGSQLLQPIVALQRDAGTELDAVDIDYIRISWDR